MSHPSQTLTGPMIEAILEDSPLFETIRGPLKTLKPTTVCFRLQFKETFIPEELLSTTMKIILQLEKPDGTKLVKDLNVDKFGLDAFVSSDISPLNTRRAIAAAIAEATPVPVLV